MKLSFISKLSTSVLCALALTSCGGGGGGGGSGAAYVSIQANPRTIDTADRTQITIRVEDIHPNGIALKVKFPNELSFVESSAEIDDGDGEFSIVPDVNVLDGNDTYLVFYLQPEDFGNDESGKLIFELKALDSSDDATIEVDPDVDDPLIDNNIEFSIEEPFFDADDQISIFIKG